MKRFRDIISLTLLLASSPLALWANDPVLTFTKTSRDYDHEAGATYAGTIVATQGASDGVWILEAVPQNGSTFIRWMDGNTNKTREIDLNPDVEEDRIQYTAIFRYSLMHCNACGDYDFLAEGNFSYAGDTVVVNAERGNIKAFHEGDNCWQLLAEPNQGYAFAQWSDGVAYNPRTIDIINEDTISFYATFIPAATVGAVDSWDPHYLMLTTTDVDDPSLSNLGSNPAAAYYASVFYDGKHAGTSQPLTMQYGFFRVEADYTSATELAGKKCHIVFKADDCIPVATLDTIIPYLVSETENVAVVLSDALYGVHVLDGGVATFADAQGIADLDIYAGGKAIINAAVSATSVTMRADPINEIDAAELLVGTGSLTNANSNIIYYDCSLDFEDFYPFSLPASISTSDVTYRSGVDAAEHFGLDIYDGAIRATKGENASAKSWVPYFDYVEYGTHEDITIGRGYNIFAEPSTWWGLDQGVGVIRFPMTINLSSGPVAAKDIAVELNDNGGTAGNADKNWNLIGLPYLSTYRGNIQMLDALDNVLDDLNYIISSETHFKSYNEPATPSAFDMKPFNAYFVQVVDGTAKLRFETPVAGRTYAPRRATADSKLRAGLVLTQGDQSDRTGVLFSDRYTNNYDINADLTKMLGNKQGLSIFSLSGAQKQAYIALPFSDATETVIPLGYSKATVGESMTFSFDEARYSADERIEALNLTDNVEGITTNLLLDSYTCTAYEAADNNRFVLGVRLANNAPAVTTDLCEEQAKPTKMRDGIYDLMGRRISDADARTLGAGVYIIINNGTARKEVIR